MLVLSIIVGILLISGRFFCIFAPINTFMSMEYWRVVILLMVFGLFGIIKGIAAKRFGVSFVFSILSFIFGIAVLFRPALLLFTDGILFYLLAAWIVLMGFVAIYSAVTVTRATGSKMWILQLMFGIIGILLGCYTFFHPVVARHYARMADRLLFYRGRYHHDRRFFFNPQISRLTYKKLDHSINTRQLKLSGVALYRKSKGDGYSG